MTNEEWINTLVNKFNESKDYKITDVRDREKLLDELRPTGEWISDGYCISSSKFKCSRCHFPELEKTNYCPNCGARMKEAENENH